VARHVALVYGSDEMTFFTVAVLAVLGWLAFARGRTIGFAQGRASAVRDMLTEEARQRACMSATFAANRKD
jgi:hypothetical protein